MCILGINRDVSSVFRLTMSLLPLIFVFPLLLPKSFLFLQPTKPISEKRRSRTHLSLDRRKILGARSKPNYEKSHRWELQKHVGAKRNTLRTVAFSFPA